MASDIKKKPRPPSLLSECYLTLQFTLFLPGVPFVYFLFPWLVCFWWPYSLPSSSLSLLREASLPGILGGFLLRRILQAFISWGAREFRILRNWLWFIFPTNSWNLVWALVKDGLATLNMPALPSPPCLEKPSLPWAYSFKKSLSFHGEVTFSFSLTL